MSNFIKHNDYWQNGTVEVGDSKQKDLFAQMKFSLWDNESNFSLRLDSDNCGNNFKNVNWIITETLTEIRFTYDFIQLRFSKIHDARFEHKSPEFETVLLKIPPGYDGSKLYELYYTIESKGLEFYYQDALTQAEIENGDFRPDWCKKSYAFYHETKKNNKYGTGKAFHLARPLMTTNNDFSIWNDILIKNKKLTITVNENLNKLEFPLHHVSGATFGYTSIGATEGTLSANRLRGSLGTGTASQQLDNIYFYVKYFASTIYCKTVLVEASGKTILADGVSAAVEVNTSTAQWYNSTYITKPDVSAQDYFASIINDGIGRIYYDSGGSGGYLSDNSNDYTTPTDPTDGSTADLLLSVYAVTSSSGGGSTNPIAMII